MMEELNEYMVAVQKKDLAGQFDALIDLVVFAMGTALRQGFPWEEGWREVYRANMTKELATKGKDSKRGYHMDIVKPEGFVPPDIKRILARSIQ